MNSPVDPFLAHAAACIKEVQDCLDRYNLNIVHEEIRHNGQLVQSRFIFAPRPAAAKSAANGAEPMVETRPEQEPVPASGLHLVRIGPDDAT